jgi:hypothetical protein
MQQESALDQEGHSSGLSQTTVSPVFKLRQTISSRKDLLLHTLITSSRSALTHGQPCVEGCNIHSSAFYSHITRGYLVPKKENKGASPSRNSLLAVSAISTTVHQCTGYKCMACTVTLHVQATRITASKPQ